MTKTSVLFPYTIHICWAAILRIAHVLYMSGINRRHWVTCSSVGMVPTGARHEALRRHCVDRISVYKREIIKSMYVCINVCMYLYLYAERWRK